jgi:hypothetical protein
VIAYTTHLSRVAILALALLLLRALPLHAQSRDSAYVMSTRAVASTVVSASVGGSLTMLPKPLTEYSVPAPMLDVRWRLAFPFGLHAFGRVGSNVATSLAQVGGYYARNLGPLTIAAGYSVSFMYGNLTYIDGFNSLEQRWTNHPMVATSWSIDDVTLSARVEAELTTAQQRTIDEQQVSSTANLFTGSSITLTLEQPFFGSTNILLGVTVAHSSNPYQSWFLYNTFQDRLVTTEFIVGFYL